MKTVQILDKNFRESIATVEIQQRIGEIAKRINTDFKGKEVDFLVVLNGAFMFAAELLKHITVNCRTLFIKLSSYEGTSSTGTVKQIIGLHDDLSNRNLIVIEDIIDTGRTIDNLLEQLKNQRCKEIRIVSLLVKPEAYQFGHPIHYKGFDIPNDFIVGFGLDYNGYGRNLESIYTIINK
jgi:hypoxanthine phosphoribosyltransferase